MELALGALIVGLGAGLFWFARWSRRDLARRLDRAIFPLWDAYRRERDRNNDEELR